MTTVFIAGSMNIKHLNEMVKERIANIVNSGFDVVVGDADGADASIQEHLWELGSSKTTVFCSGTPRNNIGNWPVRVANTDYAPGSRAFYTAKDKLMAEAADFGLMVWDAKSTGTLSNVVELLTRRKKVVVFVNKEKLFRTVGSVEQLEALVNCMSDGAKRKADEKIHLLEQIEALRHRQGEIFAESGGARYG